MAEFFSFSNLIIILINVITLGFYYTFYRFHFYRQAEPFLHYTALSFSIFSAGVALGCQAFLLDLNPYPSNEFKALILSGLVEETSKMLGVYLFFRKNQDEFSVTDGIFYGLVLGGGFGLLENILYFIDTGLWSQVLRSITALPIHMINGGLMGAFTMIFLFSGKEVSRVLRLIRASSLCICVHAIYNYSLFEDTGIALVLPFSILTLFFALELTIAKSRILLPGYVLKLLSITVEEYEIMSQHNRHEGWIQNVQKHVDGKSIKLLQIPNWRHSTVTAFFLLPAFVSFSAFLYSPDLIATTFPDLEVRDFFILFVIYPFVLACMFFFGGILNPYFFRDRMLEVPLFGSADISVDSIEENSTFFLIHLRKFYVPVSREYEKGTKVMFSLWIGIENYDGLAGQILWCKNNDDGTFGAMCLLDRIPWRFIFRWHFVRYRQNFRNLFIRKSLFT